MISLMENKSENSYPFGNAFKKAISAKEKNHRKEKHESKSKSVSDPRDNDYHSRGDVSHSDDSDEDGSKASFSNTSQVSVGSVSGATATTLKMSNVQREKLFKKPITDIFRIKRVGYDVTLSFGLEKIYWEPMAPGTEKRSKIGSFSGLFRRKKSEAQDSKENSIDIQNIIGVKILKFIPANENHEQGCVLGLGIVTFKHKDANTMGKRTYFLEHSSVDVCTKWNEIIKGYLKGIRGRPRNVKLFLQPYAGSKNGKSIYKCKVLPLFQLAGIGIDSTVIQHNEHIKQEMCHLNFSDFDCVIAMGGDGTVNQLLNGLMSRSQREQGVSSFPGFTPAKALLPIGVIPIGKTNQVAFSMMGTDDLITACIHIILGHFSPVDVISLYSEDGFYKWAFNCHYGFAGNIVHFMQRYSSLGNRRMEAAFLKALTSSKLRSYECDIEYIPSDNVISSTFNTVCRTGCQMCHKAVENQDSEEIPAVTTEMVQELRLSDSLSSLESIGSVIELKQDSPWRTLKGEFMNVSLFAIPGNCEIAPQGLSKFTHLHDGNIDLVVVKSVERKDFIRFLRRHGNSKSQFDFPFVQVVRCKEVRFRPRMPTSWNYQDYNYSEIKYEMAQQQLKDKSTALQRHNSMGVIAECSTPIRQPSFVKSKAQSMYVLDQEIDDVEELEECRYSQVGGGEDLLENGKEPQHSEEKPVGWEKSEESKFQYVGIQYQPTWTEKELARRAKLARKKDEKKREKEKKKNRSFWNIDSEICTTLELDFKVHSNLLQVCGLGISPLTEYSDIRFSCLPL